MKVCMQTSEGGLQGCMLTCEGGVEVAGVKVCMQTYEGRLKVWVQISGEGLQARVQTWDQAWKLTSAAFAQHSWGVKVLAQICQVGWKCSCKCMPRGVESLHAKLRGRLKVVMQFWSSTYIKFKEAKVWSGAIILQVAELTILGKTKIN